MGIGIVVGTSVGGKAVEVWGTRAAYGTAAFYAAVGIPCSIVVVRALSRTADTHLIAARWAPAVPFHVDVGGQVSTQQEWTTGVDSPVPKAPRRQPRVHRKFGARRRARVAYPLPPV